MSTSSQKYHHGDLRTALLNEGMALVQASGAEALTLRKLAQQLGVSHMAPYRHFPDKEALLAAIAADGFQQLKARLELAEQGGQAGREGREGQGGDALASGKVAPSAPRPSPLLLEGIAYVMFALDQPALFRLMFGSSRPKGEHAELDASRAEAFGVLLRQVPGEAASDAKRAKARGCWALVHGLALLLLDGLLQVPEGVAAEAWLAEIVGSTVSRA